MKKRVLAISLAVFMLAGLITIGSLTSGPANGDLRFLVDGDVTDRAYWLKGDDSDYSIEVQYYSEEQEGWLKYNAMLASDVDSGLLAVEVPEPPVVAADRGFIHVKDQDLNELPAGQYDIVVTRNTHSATFTIYVDQLDLSFVLGTPTDEAATATDVAYSGRVYNHDTTVDTPLDTNGNLVLGAVVNLNWFNDFEPVSELLDGNSTFIGGKANTIFSALREDEVTSSPGLDFTVTENGAIVVKESTLQAMADGSYFIDIERYGSNARFTINIGPSDVIEPPTPEPPTADPNVNLEKVRLGLDIGSRETEIKAPGRYVATGDPADGYFLNLTQESIEVPDGKTITLVENDKKGDASKFAAVKTTKARWLNGLLKKAATIRITTQDGVIEFPRTEDRPKATQKPYVNYSIFLGDGPQADGSGWTLAEKKTVTEYASASATFDIAVAPYAEASAGQLKAKPDKNAPITGWGPLGKIRLAPVQENKGKDAVAKTEYWWKLAANNDNGKWQPGSAPKKVNATTFLKGMKSELKGKEVKYKLNNVFLNGVANANANKQPVAVGTWVFTIDMAKGSKAPTNPVQITG
ncbi:MAG: hypothetical protein FWH04_08015 [Oscillospiraceae bacterium]|nr:hypothetical protein [Oscillospiraceae bacterium]